MTTAIQMISEKGAESPPPCQVRIKHESAGAVSGFSSYGPAVDLSFKPDLAAPGSLIVRGPINSCTPIPKP